jgi:hypothetical protein
VTDPLQFYKQAHLSGDSSYRAPDDAIESWRELAGQVRDELTRVGFPVSVVASNNPYPMPVGAQVWFWETPPWGVTLDWNPPVAESDRFREIVLAQDVRNQLLRYVVNATNLINKAMLDIVTEAGFRTLMDHQEGNTYIYRVLGAPTYPLN